MNRGAAKRLLCGMVRRLTGAGATVDASKPTRVLLRLPVDSLRSNGAAEGQREVDLTNADHCGQLPCAKLRNTATPKVPVQGPGISEPAMWLVCNLPNKSPISSSYCLREQPIRCRSRTYMQHQAGLKRGQNVPLALSSIDIAILDTLGASASMLMIPLGQTPAWTICSHSHLLIIWRTMLCDHPGCRVRQ